MCHYNQLSDIQYARFQILPVDLHFGLFWSAGIPTLYTCGCGRIPLDISQLTCIQLHNPIITSSVLIKEANCQFVKVSMVRSQKLNVLKICDRKTRLS